MFPNATYSINRYLNQHAAFRNRSTRFRLCALALVAGSLALVAAHLFHGLEDATSLPQNIPLSYTTPSK